MKNGDETFCVHELKNLLKEALRQKNDDTVNFIKEAIRSTARYFSVEACDNLLEFNMTEKRPTINNPEFDPDILSSMSVQKDNYLDTLDRVQSSYPQNGLQWVKDGDEVIIQVKHAFYENLYSLLNDYNK